MFCSSCAKPLADGARFCAVCGAPVPGAQGDGAGGDAPEQDNVLQTVIPTRNPKALIAYYLGVFSLIPCVGLPLGIAAAILGVMGLKFSRANPTAKGAIHAWVGIVLGGLVSVAHVVTIVAIWMHSRR